MITDVYEYRVKYRGNLENPEMDWDATDATGW